MAAGLQRPMALGDRGECMSDTPPPPPPPRARCHARRQMWRHSIHGRVQDKGKFKGFSGGSVFTIQQKKEVAACESDGSDWTTGCLPLMSIKAGDNNGDLRVRRMDLCTCVWNDLCSLSKRKVRRQGGDSTSIGVAVLGIWRIQVIDRRVHLRSPAQFLLQIGQLAARQLPNRAGAGFLKNWIFSEHHPERGACVRRSCPSNLSK